MPRLCVCAAASLIAHRHTCPPSATLKFLPDEVPLRPVASPKTATYDLVGPSLLTGPGNAALWSELLGREVRYGGDNLDRYEAHMRASAPGWSAFDIRMTCQGYLERGFVSTTPRWSA